MTWPVLSSRLTVERSLSPTRILLNKYFTFCDLILFKIVTIFIVLANDSCRALLIIKRIPEHLDKQELAVH